MITLYVGTYNDQYGDFHNLCQLLVQANTSDEDVAFNFSNCNFLRPNAVAFIGGLIRLIQARQKTVYIYWDSICNEAVKTNLRKNSFSGIFGSGSKSFEGNSIPYREDFNRNVNSILDYLEQYWLGKGWVRISKRLQDAIVGHVWEIYNNAFEHSDSLIGVYSCGQHFPRQNELVLSVIDFGQGIAGKIRNYLRSDLRSSSLNAASCMRWAFQRGNTTKSILEGPGGLGLDLLKSFIAINHGKLEVYSNEGYALINGDGERFVDIPFSFPGTIFHITLRCDENLYHLSDENIN